MQRHHEFDKNMSHSQGRPETGPVRRRPTPASRSHIPAAGDMWRIVTARKRPAPRSGPKAAADQGGAPERLRERVSGGVWRAESDETENYVYAIPLHDPPNRVETN